jgi:hypothetical protein
MLTVSLRSILDHDIILLVGTGKFFSVLLLRFMLLANLAAAMCCVWCTSFSLSVVRLHTSPARQFCGFICMCAELPAVMLHTMHCENLSCASWFH